MAKIVILGAGLSGLSAAYHLEKKGFNSYKLFEKEGSIGGLCSSITADGFTFDFTGHVIHIHNEIFKNFVEYTIGFNNLLEITRNSWVYSHDVYTRYPFQRHLFGLPAHVISECIKGFAKKTKQPSDILNFPDWINHHFGPGFARHFFMPFQKKNLAYDLNKITASWTQRFVPATSLEQIIAGARHDIHEMSTTTYNGQFYYPKQGGMRSWMDSIERSLTHPAFTNMAVDAIDIDQKCVVFSNGHYEFYDTLVTTIPLNLLLNKIIDRSTTDFKRAAPNLICNSVINFNLGLKKPPFTDKHWIYFPEKKFPFYRLGFPSNLTHAMAPAGCSSISGEYAYFKKPKMPSEQLVKKSVNLIKHLFGISDEEIAIQKVITIPHAYVIYDQWREENLAKLLTALEQHDIYSIGRYGAWKYASMQEAVLDGYEIAQVIASKDSLFSDQAKIQRNKAKQTFSPFTAKTP